MLKNLFVSSLVIGLLFSGCGQKVVQKERPRPVRYVEASEQKPLMRRSFAGISAADIEAKLSFKVKGSIEKLNFTLGEQVTAGDILAELDNSDFSIKVQEAEASLLKAEAQERKAAADYKRIRDLYETRSAAKAELDASRAASESAKASVETVRQQLAFARKELAYTKLYAPIDGSIAQKLVEVNENIQPGQTIFMLTSTGYIEVNLAIPESIIGEVKRGEHVKVKFDAIPLKVFNALVTEVGSASVGGTTFPVKVRLTEADPFLRSGMAAEVSFIFQRPTETNAIFLPSESVQIEDKQTFVYIAVPDGEGLATVEKREVQIGPLTNQGILVIKGVKSGELVITAGIHFLREGMVVKL